MTKQIPLLILVCIGLQGCAAQGVWNHPTKVEADFKLDVYKCERDGEEYAANLGFHGNPLIVRDRGRDCMKAHGYTWKPNN